MILAVVIGVVVTALVTAVVELETQQVQLPLLDKEVALDLQIPDATLQTKSLRQFHISRRSYLWNTFVIVADYIFVTVNIFDTALITSLVRFN